METHTIPDHISPSTDIKHRIMQLNSLKEDQEARLKRHLHEFYYALQPASLIKSAVKGLSHDVEFKHDAVKETLNIGTNFLLDTLVFRKGTGIKKYLLNQGLKKLVSYFMNIKK